MALLLTWLLIWVVKELLQRLFARELDSFAEWIRELMLALISATGGVATSPQLRKWLGRTMITAGIFCLALAVYYAKAAELPSSPTNVLVGVAAIGLGRHLFHGRPVTRSWLLTLWGTLFMASAVANFLTWGPFDISDIVYMPGWVLLGQGGFLFAYKMNPLSAEDKDPGDAAVLIGLGAIFIGAGDVWWMAHESISIAYFVTLFGAAVSSFVAGLMMLAEGPRLGKPQILST